MKHAYLVLAHTDPVALHRLLRALAHEGVHFYLHVDAAGDDALVDVGRGRPDVTLVPRQRIRYMAWSMVDATLRMARAAVADGHDRYTLISGSDYPIVSNARIVDYLSSSDEELITFWRLADRPHWQHKVQYHYPVELIPIRDLRSSLARRVFWAGFRRLRRFAPKREHPVDLIPFGGSQWWTLTHPCLEHVLQVVDSRPDFVRFHRTTESPDELFFQTLVLNSPFAPRVRGFATYERWRETLEPQVAVTVKDQKRRMIPDEDMNLRYIDWNGELTGKREAPAVLDMRDLARMRTSECLLARKFDSVRSESLLNALDEMRCEPDSPQPQALADR